MKRRTRCVQLRRSCSAACCGCSGSEPRNDPDLQPRGASTPENIVSVSAILFVVPPGLELGPLVFCFLFPNTHHVFTAFFPSVALLDKRCKNATT